MNKIEIKITGKRGVGKTTLANYLKKIFESFKQDRIIIKEIDFSKIDIVIIDGEGNE